MVYIILGKGFEETEAIAPYDILKRGGVDVQFAAVGETPVPSGRGVMVFAEKSVSDIDPQDAEMIVIPGGMAGVESILGSCEALNVVKACWDLGKFTAAICAGPLVLTRLGILDGKRAVCYPGLDSDMSGDMIAGAVTVTDGKVITGRSAGTALDFGLKLLEVLKGKETAAQVAETIYYDGYDRA